MIKFLSMLTLVAAMSLSAFSQQMNTRKAADRGSDIKNQQRYESAKLEMETRGIAINTLGLTAKEIDGFDRWYNVYTQSKKSIDARRNILIAQYKEEMAEDDTYKDERNETGDFIEDYMELDIAEMELKKDIFDKLEDIVGPQKALDFFALEDMFINRAKRRMMVEKLPTLRFYIPVVNSYDIALNDFRNWRKVNIDGKVDLNHDFTYNGLEKLLNAAEKMAMAENIRVANFNSRKQMIMRNAAKLQEDWKSLAHADLAKEAFTATAELLGDIASEERFTTRTKWITQLRNAASAIKPDRKLTDQAGTVYNFFDTAELIVNDLVRQANGETDYFYGSDK